MTAASSNPNAHLFVSYENSAKYRNAPLKSSSLLGIYTSHLRKNHFPKLLERPDVPPEDKIKIRQLLRKPWNPYIRRHTGLHEKARLVNEHMLRQHAGWTKSSQMVEIYTHELGDESSEDLLLAYGIDIRNNDSNKDEKTQQALAALKPIICLNCNEPNKPGSKVCLSCKMILSIDEYHAIISESEGTKKSLDQIKAQHEQTKKELKELIDTRQDQFEKYMTDILEARLKLASPMAAPLLAYSSPKDPIVKRLEKQVREEEKKIKGDLRNNVPRE